MKKLIVLALVASVALLAGCEEETKTIKWYSEHPDEANAVNTKCLKSGIDSINCKNADRGLGVIEAKASLKELAGK